MLKRLKIKFVIINMLLLLLVLSAIFGGVIYFMYQTSEQEALQAMEMAIQNDGKFPKGNDMDSRKPEGGKAPDPLPDNHMQRNLFIAKLDQNGNVLEIQAEFNVLDELSDAEAFVLKIAENENNSGITETEIGQFRYLKEEKDYGMILVFSDRSFELAMLRRLILISVIIGIASLVVLFIISLFLATWAIEPVKKSWEKQKQFVADASHELKTPLTVIGTNVDVVLANEDDTVKNQKKWLHYIKDESSRMSDLVNDLLYLAKVDNHEDKLVLSSFLFSDLVTESALFFEPLVYEKGKTMETDIAPRIFMTGDQKKMKQLLMILLDNALKYSDENGHIALSLKSEKDKIKLTVTNTGKKIPPEDLDRIFERFYQVDASRDRKVGGHGLGLSIAKSIVEDHKGTIAVSSTEENTSFTVTFPHNA